jgi:hypothetical protein
MRISQSADFFGLYTWRTKDGRESLTLFDSITIIQNLIFLLVMFESMIMCIPFNKIFYPPYTKLNSEGLNWILKIAANI